MTMDNIIAAVDDYAAGLVAQAQAEGSRALSALRAEFDAYVEAHPTVAPSKLTLGVCTHSTFRQSVYADLGKLYDSIIASGVTTIRERMSETAFFGAQLVLWQRLRDAGVGVQAICGAYGSMSNRAQLQANMLKAADCLVAVEGFNEPDNNGVTIKDYLPTTADQQRWLYSTVRSQPTLSHVRVVAPSLRDRNPALGAELRELYAAISGSYDAANLHFYPGKAGPEPALTQRLSLLPPFAPVVITEFGWNTGLGVKGAGATMSEDEQASYYVRMLAALRKQPRVVAAFAYELYDDADPTSVSYQSHWGLFRADRSAKPVLAVVRDQP